MMAGETSIRYGDSVEVDGKFALYNEDNEGDAILVAEQNGEVVAFAQVSGAYIYHLESNAKGTGTAIVDWLKEQYNELYARNVGSKAAGYWLKQGFEQDGATNERPGEFNYIWYAE
jgi:hypothetical protein